MNRTYEISRAERSIAGPLDELDDRALYGLLGDAWYAQRRLVPGSGVYVAPSGVLAPSEEVGKHEFDAVTPMLRSALDQPYRFGVVACVARALKLSSRWRMPASVVAELAVRKGLAVSRIAPSASGRNERRVG